jgi:hypothetical protein
MTLSMKLDLDSSDKLVDTGFMTRLVVFVQETGIFDIPTTSHKLSPHTYIKTSPLTQCVGKPTPFFSTIHTEPFPNLATLNNSSGQISDSTDPVHRYVRDRDALWLWHGTLHRFGVRREMMTPLNNPMKMERAHATSTEIG